MATKGTQAATQTPAKELDTRRPYQLMQEDIAAVAVEGEGLAFKLAAEAIDKIAQAETLDEIFAVNDTANEKSTEDVANHFDEPLGIVDVSFSRSDSKYAQGTLGYYAALNVIDGAHREFVVTTGAPNIVASLRQAQRKGFFSPEQPLWVEFRGKSTGNGTLYTMHAAAKAPF